MPQDPCSTEFRSINGSASIYGDKEKGMMMKEIMGDWVGEHVWVTLRLFLGASRMKGKLSKVDESGVLLELPKGQTFVPLTSILHISKK